MSEPMEPAIMNWILSTAGAAFLAVIGHLHFRLGRAEETARKEAAAAADVARAGDRDLWNELGKQSESSREFRERMAGVIVTKDDLRESQAAMKIELHEMERRLMAVLQPERRIRGGA